MFEKVDNGSMVLVDMLLKAISVLMVFEKVDNWEGNLCAFGIWEGNLCAIEGDLSTIDKVDSWETLLKDVCEQKGGVETETWGNWAERE